MAGGGRWRVGRAAGQRRVGTAALVDSTMLRAVETLRGMGVPVCFEQVALVPERARRLADGRIEYELTRVDVAVPAGPVDAALDALCAADPDYTWERAGRTPVVYPVHGGDLSWSVPPVEVAGRDWREALGRIGLDQHGIALFPRGLERQPDRSLPRSLIAGGSARHWLTAVVEHVDNGRHWTLGGVAGSRSLVIGQV